MPQYAILRFSKQKGGAARPLEAHHERQKDNYASNPDINPERSRYNFHFIQPVDSYRNEVDSRIEAAGCKTRKDSTRFVDTLITASPEFFKGKSKAEIKAFFERALEFMIKKVGKDNIFTSVVHVDEKTPHLHLCFTPITKDGRLSAKEILGNRANLTKWQDDFWKHMVKSYPDLERGESASTTGRQHIPTRIFKQTVNLTKQAARIEAVIDSMNAFNTGNKKTELSALLRKFFPQMTSFQSQIKKYEGEFSRLNKENAILSKKANERESMKDQFSAASLKKELDYIESIMKAIPPEIREAAEAEISTQVQRKTNQKRR